MGAHTLDLTPLALTLTNDAKLILGAQVNILECQKGGEKCLLLLCECVKV